MEEEFGVIEYRHPLEDLVEKIATNLPQFSAGTLSIGDYGKDNEVNFFIKEIIRKNIFSCKDICRTVLLAEQKQIKNQTRIKIHSIDDDVGKIAKRYKEQYMKENPNVAYFTILRHPKIIIPSRTGLS